MDIKKMLLEDVCKTYGVRLGSYQNSGALLQGLDMEVAAVRTAVLAGYADGIPLILYDSTKPELETLFSIAHELGHIRLGHLNFRSWFCWEMDDVSEREADAFAVQLLARELARCYELDA